VYVRSFAENVTLAGTFFLIRPKQCPARPLALQPNHPITFIYLGLLKRAQKARDDTARKTVATVGGAGRSSGQ
jgi:hypothetical protein